jgi:hypothetical protein
VAVQVSLLEGISTSRCLAPLDIATDFDGMCWLEVRSKGLEPLLLSLATV